MSKYLFDEFELKSIYTATGLDIQKKISSTPSDTLINNSVTELTEYFYQLYEIPEIQLHLEQKTAENIVEIMEKGAAGEQGIPSLPNSKFARAEIFRVRVPFTGDPALLRVSLTGGTLEAKIDEHHIVIDIYRLERYQHQYSSIRQLHSKLQILSIKVDAVNSKIRSRNSEFRITIERELTLLRESLQQGLELLVQQGIPLYLRPDSVLNIPLFPQRKLVLLKGCGNDPVLTDELYEMLLKSMERVLTFVETSPSSFVHADETDFRNHLLVILNDGFGLANATGETFNGKGKTDILMKFGSGYGFICECKMWKGARDVSDALNQLFGYITWRDTKTALIFFYRGKSPVETFKKAERAIETSAAFIQKQESDSQYRSSYIVKHPSKDVEVCLELMFFDVSSNRPNLNSPSTESR